jgi:hypothetical protein
MSEHDELTAAERDALRSLAQDAPAERAQEDATVARLRAAGLVGGAPAVGRNSRPLRIAMAAAAAILVYLAGVYSGRATAPQSTRHLPTATAPDSGSDSQAATVAATASAGGTTIIRF